MNFKLDIEDYKKLRTLLMTHPASEVYELIIKLDSQVSSLLQEARHKPSVTMAKNGGQ